jgi:UDP-N-acetylglucosamine acyltransferase
MSIHPTALVAQGAELGADVEVGSYAIIEDDTRIGEGCHIGPHCVVKSGVRLGSRCRLDVGVVLGSEPQDRKFQGEPTFVHLGDDNILREYVTIHRATGEGEATVVGDDNFLMAYCHLGHNVRLGSHVMIASYAGISGHCCIGDNANLGGLVGLHQYVTVGRLAMIGGCSRVVRDVPPFTTAVGVPAEIHGINSVGLRRQGVTQDEEIAVRRAFRLLFRSELNTSDAMAAIEAEVEPTTHVRELVEFMQRIDQGRAGRQRNPR